MKKAPETDAPVRIQDDLYRFVNGEQLKTLEIPSDLPAIGAFVSLHLDVEKRLMSDFEAFSKGEKDPGVPAVADAVRLYRKALDVDAREAAGIAPVLPLLEKIKNIKDAEAYNAVAADLLLDHVPFPLTVDVVEDVTDTSRQCLCLFDPPTILPDKNLYDKKLVRRLLLSSYKKMVASLLALTPLTKKEQKAYLRDAVAFDDRLRRKVKSQVEAADYVKLFNPMSVDEVAECLRPLDVKGLLRALWGDAAPSTVNVGTPDFVRGFGEILSGETFESFIRWTYVNTLLGYAPALSRTIAGLANAYRRRLTGVKEEPTAEKQAFRLASALYDQPLGVYYGRAYFGEEAKADVVEMVRQIIAAYRARIADNDFLSPATKEKAILKLDEIKIKMGYPDGYDAYYDGLKVQQEDSFFDAMHALIRARIRRMIEKFTRPTDFTEWAMPGHMVNACYDPFKNDITFPAAILQKPFYSLSQTREENLGGIGAVIAHEISHAFDNNGAHFDERGNLHDWWTEEDFKQFEARTQGMIEQYDGIPFHGGKVNGKLVVSENIADNGGMAATLQIMRGIPDADYKAYFMNFARVWCQKASESYIRLLLTNDVHSPAELRANMTPRNFAEWYATFDVAPTDGMYIPEDKRVSIW